MDWDEYYKECYYKEIERKNTLNDTFNAFLTIITILGGGFFVILGKLINLNYQLDNSYLLVISIIIVLLIIIFFIKLFIYMYKVHYDNKYEYVRNPEEIETKKKEYYDYYMEYYKEYFKDTGKSVDDLVEERIKEDIKLNYIEATTKNNETNIIRINNNQKLNKLILTTSIILAIVYIGTLFIDDNNSDVKEVRIEVSEDTNNGNRPLPPPPERLTTKVITETHSKKPNPNCEKR